jgi:glycosyltransferase involved in cell wall biosynthesis
MKIAVVIPSYRVKQHILQLIPEIGEEVVKIYVVDDKCPENSGLYVQEHCTDARVEVLFNEKNLGVGGAVKTGYKKALADKFDVVVKLDGDGQMDPKLIPVLVKPILNHKADYVKGNRFYNIDTLMAMPRLRLFGNSMLSFINKFVNGYWNLMDPTNGFTAIHYQALKLLPLDKIENRYFFESDMLFRLGTVRAVVADMPMDAKYADEVSHLNIRKVLFEFPPKYFVRFFKRIFYNYFLRDFNVASAELIFGSLFFVFGFIIGSYYWSESIRTGISATSGTVMLAALPVILGTQLLLSALSFDIQNLPKDCLND